MSIQDIVIALAALVLGALVASAGGAMRRRRALGSRREAEAAPSAERARPAVERAPAPGAAAAATATATTTAATDAMAADAAADPETLTPSVRAERLRNLLLSRMSHDIRTPLNSVIALSQLLVDGSAGPL